MLSSSDTAPVAELEDLEVAWNSTLQFTMQSSFHLLIGSLCSLGVSLSRCLALNTGDRNNVPWRTLNKYLQNKQFQISCLEADSRLFPGTLKETKHHSSNPEACSSL